MRYSKLPVNVVLCLVMLARRSVQDVQRLDTGYLYPVGEKGNGREKDLKCAFWYSGKVHIQLTKLLLQRDGPVPSTFNTIFDFQKNTIIHLAVLYNLKTERIGALWLVHLYVNRVVSYYEYLNKELNYAAGVAVEKMSVTQDYIVEKLESETVVHCTGGNRFDWSKKQFAGAQLSSDNLRALIEQNNREMNEMLVKNNSAAVDNINDFELSNVLLQNVRVRESFHKIFFNVNNYLDIDVDWKCANKSFFSVGRKTRDLDFATNNLQPIKSYFSMVFDVLKVIVLRMTWKILTFLRLACHAYRPSYAKKWFYKLQDFADMFRLHHDRHIEFLLGAFRDVQIKNIEFIDPLIGYAQHELTMLSESLNCDATRPFNLSFENNNYNPANPYHIDEMIKMEILAKANTFNCFLKENVIKRDFGITWALLHYIDEPKPYELFEQ